MARENNGEFMRIDEYDVHSEQFFHDDEFNRDVEIALHKRDSYEGGSSEEIQSLPDASAISNAAFAGTAAGLKSKKEKERHRQKTLNNLAGTAAATLKTGAITVAAIIAVSASPAAVKLGFEKPPLLPDNTTSVSAAEIHSHSGGWQTTTQPTCSSAGELTLKCDSCNEILETKPLPQLNHIAGDWTVIKTAGCVQNGTEEQCCKLCGKKLNEKELVAKGHSESEWITLVAATCTTDGSRYTKCTDCGETLVTQAVAATGHTAGSWTLTTCASCSAEGRQTLHCINCGMEMDSLYIPKTSHEESGWIIDTAKTCTTEGHQHTQCINCGAHISESTIPASHNVVTVSGYAATCTTDGMTDEEYCADCQTWFLQPIPIPSTGHTEEQVPPVAATCTSEGSTAGTRCTVCGEYTVPVTTVAALGHDWQDVAGTTESTQHYCQQCNTYENHQWTDGGPNGHQCSECLIFRAHTFNNLDANDAPTADSTCNDCGYQFGT